jgi:Lar family restriction alleviation protein
MDALHVVFTEATTRYTIINGLRECPHCGGRASVGRQKEAYFVNCVDCLASTNLLIQEAMPETEAEAIEQWNART